jgi:hypothetical protein
MKATELRIGNWYSSGVDMDTGEQVYNQVLPDLYMNWHVNGCWAEPIQLTEEWLERFGFEKIQFSIPTAYKTKDGFRIKEYEQGYCMQYKHGTVIIKNVHTLQNLHFALTGEELQTDQTDKKVNQ